MSLPPHEKRHGHTETLRRILASKVLLGHTQNRHQLLESPPADLRDVGAEDVKLLIQAMIAAAHANGSLEDDEAGRITGIMRSTVLDDEERRRLEQIIGEPQCLETLIRQVATPKMAARFYAVSLAVVDKDSLVNRAYLHYLALRLGLPADLVVRLNRRMGLRL